ncbi:hypothetical protein H257_02237, partial [Aphanomyces astaci]
MVVGRARSVSAAARTESRSQQRRKQRGCFIPQPDPGAANMDHSSAGMTPPPTARPRGPADTSGAQDDDATTVSSVGDHAALAEQAATQVSDDHASPYSFLRMHTVLSHSIVDLRNSIQRNQRSLRVLQEVRAAMASTLGSGPHDMSQARHALGDEVEFLTATLSEVNAEVLDLRTALDSSRRGPWIRHTQNGMGPTTCYKRLKSRSDPWSKGNTTSGSRVTKP